MQVHTHRVKEKSAARARARGVFPNLIHTLARAVYEIIHTHTHTPRPPTAVQMATSRTCALAPLPSAERTRRELDAAGLLDTEVRAFRCDHPTTAEPALALPLVSDCILNEKPSEGKNGSSSNTASAAALQPSSPTIKESNGSLGQATLCRSPCSRHRIANAARILRSKMPSLGPALNSALEPRLGAALTADAALPRRWEKLGDTILFAPKALFDAKDEPAGVALHTELSEEQRDTILASVASGARRAAPRRPRLHRGEPASQVDRADLGGRECSATVRGDGT